MKSILNNLCISKFEIDVIGSIFSTKLSMISSNHRFYDRMISSKRLSKSASNNLSLMNLYSSMIIMINILFSLSMLMISSYLLSYNTKFNSFSTPSSVNSNYAILTSSRSFLISIFIDLYLSILFIFRNQSMREKCFTNLI